MKKILSFLPLALLFVAIVSCTKDTYRHQISIVHPNGIAALFADQTADSVLFFTYDSYEVKSYGSESWFIVRNDNKYPSSLKVPYDYYNIYLFRVNLDFKPNDTDKARYAYVNVRSYGLDDWNQTASAGFCQLNCHNIVRPSLSLVKEDGLVTGYKCEATDSATQLRDSLIFEAYDAWTLSVPEDAFLTVSKTEGGAGIHRIGVQLTANSGKEERSNEVVLKSSNGATSRIKFTQSPVKEKK